MEACVFHGVGAERYSYDYEHDIAITKNFVGLAFIVTSEVYCFSSLHQVLRIPDRLPVFNREYQNHMYSVSAYYTAAVVSVLTTTWIYPMFAGMTEYYWFEFEDRSFLDFCYYEAGMIACCLAGNLFGFMFGCLFSDELMAIAAM